MLKVHKCRFSDANDVTIATATAPTSLPFPGPSSAHQRPFLTQRPSFTSRKGYNTNDSFTIKIVQAKGQNKLSFLNEGQMFTENTANVPYLSNVVQEKWGMGEDYVMVTSDGLRVEDSDGTRGMPTLCFMVWYFDVGVGNLLSIIHSF